MKMSFAAFVELNNELLITCVIIVAPPPLHLVNPAVAVHDRHVVDAHAAGAAGWYWVPAFS